MKLSKKHPNITEGSEILANEESRKCDASVCHMTLPTKPISAKTWKIFPHDYRGDNRLCPPNNFLLAFNSKIGLIETIKLGTNQSGNHGRFDNKAESRFYETTK